MPDLIELLAKHTDAEHIDVFTYSAGATVGSDGLAIVGRDADATAAMRTSPLGEVYHAAPDADFRELRRRHDATMPTAPSGRRSPPT